jgi:hypothetical protein
MLQLNFLQNPLGNQYASNNVVTYIIIQDTLCH